MAKKVSVSLDDLKRDKKKLLPGLARIMDSRSVATVLEVDYDTDDQKLASIWFDACLGSYKQFCDRPEIYRHMQVENFAAFVDKLKGSSGHLGRHWSMDHAIESPTWAQDHMGKVPVIIHGSIAVEQVDWADTLRQNFEWPHEWEVHFTGDVLVDKIEDLDEDKTVKVAKILPREADSRVRQHKAKTAKPITVC